MYTVEITIEAEKQLTEQQLFAVAGVGGAATGSPGQHRLETTLTEDGADMLDALERAVTRILALVPGQLIAVEAMTIDEALRRIDAGQPPVPPC
jgi:hypothetical protein